MRLGNMHIHYPALARLWRWLGLFFCCVPSASKRFAGADGKEILEADFSEVAFDDEELPNLWSKASTAYVIV